MSIKNVSIKNVSIKNVSIFTDGSSEVYRNNDGNRCGGIGIWFDNDLVSISKSYKSQNVSNQIMELTACIEGIKKCANVNKGSEWNLIIYTDSMYTINSVTIWVDNWINNGWKRKVGKQLKPIQNVELIKELYKLTNKHTVKYVHVRSHKKEPSINDNDEWYKWNGNNKADRLANGAMMSIKENID